MSRAAADLVLAAARRAVAGAVAAGGPEPDLTPDRLAAALEADDGARAALDAAVAERRRAEPPLDPPSGAARAARRRRADEVHHAAGDLVLAGELVQDGPGRYRLPGFGPSTWRALAALRDAPGTAEAAWAAVVAHHPLRDLGDAAPVGAAGPAPDPGRERTALRLLAMEAHRQDLRHALISGEAAAAGARERGEERAAAAVEADCAALRIAIAEIDAAVEAAWREGAGG